MSFDFIIYGGAFNPPTYAHKYVTDALSSRNISKEILICPTYTHRLKADMVSFDLRMEMCKSMYSRSARITVSDIEKILNDNGGDGSTVDMVKHFHAMNKRNFAILVGEDNAINFSLWKSNEWLMDNATFIVLPRGGYHSDVNQWYNKSPHMYLGDVKPLKYSSSEARYEISMGIDVSDKIDKAVLSIIHKNGLYTTN